MTVETVRLADYCEIVSGATPRRDHPEYWGGDIAWVTPKDIRNLDGAILADTPEHITQAGYDSCSTRLLPEGSVLFSSRAPIGLVAVTGREMCTNQGFKSLIPGPDVDAGYLYWCLKREAPRIAAKSSGTTFTEISRKGMEQVKIPLPPLPEQRRIAAILDKADAVRRKRQQTLDLADQFLRSAFLDLFGDPVTNPKGWPVKRLGEVGEIQGGLQVTSKRSKNPIEVPYLRVANVYRDALDLTEIKTIRVTTAELERVALRPSDVLIVEGHGNRDEVGRSAVWDGSIDSCVHQNHLIRVRPTDEILASQYLSFYLNSSGGRRQMFRSGRTTSGLNTISTRNVKETKILLPPIEEQERFVHLRSDVSFARQRLEEGISMAETLLGSLTQRAFRGEL